MSLSAELCRSVHSEYIQPRDRESNNEAGDGLDHVQDRSDANDNAHASAYSTCVGVTIAASINCKH